MKNLFLIFCCFFVFTNCNSDDTSKNDSLENKMMFKGDEFNLADYCYYYEYDSQYDGEIVRLDLRDSDIDSQKKIEFQFPMIELSELDGIYTYNPEYASPEYNPQSNFFKGIIDYSSDGTNPDEFLITGGQIEINRRGENIEINFEVQTNDGLATGHFEGRFVDNN